MDFEQKNEETDIDISLTYQVSQDDGYSRGEWTSDYNTESSSGEWTTDSDLNNEIDSSEEIEEVESEKDEDNDQIMRPQTLKRSARLGKKVKKTYFDLCN